MTALPHNACRRRLLLATSLGPLLTACGGGGGGDNTPPSAEQPTIDEFSLAAPALVGEPATLTARYRCGSGTVEPALGAVRSGGTIQTPVLPDTRRFRLVVSRPGAADAIRELTVQPAWRNRLRSFDAPAMTGHAVAVVGSHAPLVLGGSRGAGVLSSAIERFDPVSQSFTPLGQLLTGRSEMSAVPISHHEVLVFGGSTSGVQPPFAEIVDARTGATRHGGSMMLPRAQHAAVGLADGRVAAVGGSQRNSLELWSPGSNTWALAGNRMAHVRQHATATRLPDGRVLIVGGFTESAGYRFAEIFDPANETFTPVADAPAERRWLHAAITLADDTVLIVGGENEGGPLASVWRFDPASGRFVAQPPLAAPRSIVRAVAGPGDEVLMFGGELEPDVGLATAAAWRAGTSRELPAMPGGRAWHSLTRLADGRLLVLGGQHRTALVGGGLLFD
jgi:hypothetical protein